MKIQITLEGMKDLNRVKEIASEIRKIKEVKSIEVNLSSEYDKI